MADSREDRIRARAHQIWLNEGQPSGGEERHWLQAASDIDAEDAKGADAKKPAVKKASAPAAKTAVAPKKPAVAAAKKSGAAPAIAKLSKDAKKPAKKA